MKEDKGHKHEDMILQMDILENRIQQQIEKYKIFDDI